MSAKGISADNRPELARAIRRSRLAQRFIKEEIWGMITDYLAQREQDLAIDALWNGERTVEETALKSAHARGRKDEISFIVVLLERWIKEGQEAQQILEKLGVRI